MSQGARGTARQAPTTRSRPRKPHQPELARARARKTYAASFALLAYMSTYSCPDSRITSAITESVTARST